MPNLSGSVVNAPHRAIATGIGSFVSGVGGESRSASKTGCKPSSDPSPGVLVNSVSFGEYPVHAACAVTGMARSHKIRQGIVFSVVIQVVNGDAAGAGPFPISQRFAAPMTGMRSSTMRFVEDKAMFQHCAITRRKRMTHRAAGFVSGHNATLLEEG